MNALEPAVNPVQMSPEINELATALSIAQGEIDNPSKNAQNPYFKSQYADLAEVLNVVRPAFSRNGLSIIQMPSIVGEGYTLMKEPVDPANPDGPQKVSVGGTVAVTTMVAHKSGQWLSTTVHAPVLGSNPSQELGKVVTYLRRYCASAMAAVAQEDNDGNDEHQRAGMQSRAYAPPAAVQQAPRRRSPAPISMPQLKRLKMLIEQSGADEARLVEHFNAQSLDRIANDRFEEAEKMLQVKIRQNEAVKQEAAPEAPPEE